MKKNNDLEYDEQEIVQYINCKEYPNKGCYGECGSCGVQIKGKQRLAELEDKIENGTLVELPCKVGDKVFVIAKQGMDIYTVEETTVCDFWFSTTENRFYPVDVNEIPLEKVFLTKAEAEKQLENQRGAK